MLFSSRAERVVEQVAMFWDPKNAWGFGLETARLKDWILTTNVPWSTYLCNFIDDLLMTILFS